MNTASTKQTDMQYERIIKRIAPLWPLDSFVAVNPYWGFADQPFSKAASYLQETVGERVIMDRRWYLDQVKSGKISLADILKAAESMGVSGDDSDWMTYLQEAGQPSMRMRVLPELLDRQGHASISQYVVEQISRFLAAYYDRGQSLWRLPTDSESGLFASWRQYTLMDKSLKPMGLKAVRPLLLNLNPDATKAAAWAQQTLKIPETIEDDYLFMLLKSVGGWASWCRYLLWTAELQGKSQTDLEDLLAIRMVWEALLSQTADQDALVQWKKQLHSWMLNGKGAAENDALRGEVLLMAAENAFRQQVAKSIRHCRSYQNQAVPDSLPKVQAAFCIDVRSEVFRRHLESSMPDLETIGFAGFFGVMMDYARQGDQHRRTQTPVLLNPAVHVEEQGPQALIQKRFRRLRIGAEWKQFKLSATSCFSFVETAGLSYIGRLLADTLGWHQPSVHPDQAGLKDEERASMHCVLPESLNMDQRVQMAEFILNGLGISQGAAPVVLLVGHGSSTTNNPHRAGLDCGACAGQTGEMNARAAASLLNDPGVRKGLQKKGLSLSDQTCFIPALHDTTTDRVEILDNFSDPRLDPETRDEITAALEKAANLSRLERMLRLEPEIHDPELVAQNVNSRGRDWSQVRPEWALAGNAAFIAAPRWRTREMNLDGRAFLHDYDPEKDPDFSVLKLIMTAPLVVANWINLQYYGSTVDNQRQGCGNKVLHNVIGGTVGVLEGNGGDLRVGLSEQSLRDNHSGLQHEPLRLSAFIEAPKEAMDQVIEGEEILRHLVDNRWLSIQQISPDGNIYHRRAAGDWIGI
ncbi:YbcC family protein [Acidihalobacter prosperus]